MYKRQPLYRSGLAAGAAVKGSALQGRPAGSGSHKIMPVPAKGDFAVGAQIYGEPELSVLRQGQQDGGDIRSHKAAQKRQEGQGAAVRHGKPDRAGEAVTADRAARASGLVLATVTAVRVSLPFPLAANLAPAGGFQFTSQAILPPQRKAEKGADVYKRQAEPSVMTATILPFVVYS